MKGLNYDLLLFHVREAAEELESLLARIKATLGEPVSEDEKVWTSLYDKGINEAGLEGSLGHAYHHLNFAWNVRHKESKDANKHFDRDEKFPRAFTRFWPKSILKKRKRIDIPRGSK